MSLSSFHSSCFYRALVKIKRNGSLWGKQISFKIRAKIRSSCFPTCGWREQKSSAEKSCGQFLLQKTCPVLWLQCILGEVWFFYWLSPWCRYLQAGQWGRRLWATQGRPGLLGALCGWPDRVLRISHQPPAGPLTRPLLCATLGCRCWWMAVPAGNTSAQRQWACGDWVSFISDSEDISPCIELLVCDVPGASRWVAVSEGTEGAVHSLIGQLSLITWWARRQGLRSSQVFVRFLLGLCMNIFTLIQKSNQNNKHGEK